MEWLAGLGALGLLGLCCGAKLAALLLVGLRDRSTGTPEGPTPAQEAGTDGGATEKVGRDACRWC